MAAAAGGGAPSTTFFEARYVKEMDLNCTHNGVDIVYLPTSNFLCLGYIGTVQTKFCTCLRCSISSHHTKHKHFWAGIYLKAGPNAVYFMPMLPTGCILDKQLAS
eukprot:5375571-Ditylum_brightwellii.AAC.1